MSGFAALFSNRFKLEDVPDQRGKTAIVTGGSAGIGAGIALGLALAGAKVHIVSSTPEHGEATAKAINEQVQQSSTGSPKFPSGEAFFHAVDLGDLKSVRAFAEEMKETLAIKKAEGIPEQGLGSKGRPEGEEIGGLNYLICNAGIGVAPYGETKDGLPNHFAVNHLSHFLLVTALLPLLDQTQRLPRSQPGDTRIILQSSELHRASDSNKFTSLEDVGKADATVMYSRSKLMMILFARQLAKRKLTPAGNKTLAIAVHPGAVATGQEKGTEEAYGFPGTVLVAASRLLFKTPEQGAEAALWATTSPIIAEQRDKYQGVYLRQPDDSLGSESSQAQDEEAAANLWELSKKVLKEKIGYEIDY